MGVGIAGGSFSVGIAYVSRWFPKEQQGAALGIFGAGNVGAAVTKFLRTDRDGRLWLAHGRLRLGGGDRHHGRAVLSLGRRTIRIIAARRAAKQAAGQSFVSQLEPLKNIQVWRFSLYYFFVFGAFVALALWLPRYLMGVYGLDIQTAGIIGAAYSIPGSLFRAYGGYLSDRHGARTVMYWTFIVSVVALFLPLLPADDLHRRRHQRPDHVPHGDRRRALSR